MISEPVVDLVDPLMIFRRIADENRRRQMLLRGCEPEKNRWLKACQEELGEKFSRFKADCAIYDTVFVVLLETHYRLLQFSIVGATREAQKRGTLDTRAQAKYSRKPIPEAPFRRVASPTLGSRK